MRRCQKFSSKNRLKGNRSNDEEHRGSWSVWSICVKAIFDLWGAKMGSVDQRLILRIIGAGGMMSAACALYEA